MQPRVTNERMITVKYITRSKQNGEEHFIFSAEVYNPQLDEYFESRFQLIIDKSEMVSIHVEQGYKTPDFSDVVKAIGRMLEILKKPPRNTAYVCVYKNLNDVYVGTHGDWIIKTASGKMILKAIPLRTIRECFFQLEELAQN